MSPTKPKAATKAAAPTRKTRSPSNPAAKAEEAVTVLQRRLDRQQASLGEARVEVTSLEREIMATKARLEYAQSNPDLPHDAPSPL